MSFNQYRTNPSQAVSNFKGRTETSKAWPSTAVSTWMNGGLFGGALELSYTGGIFHDLPFTDGLNYFGCETSGTLTFSIDATVDILVVGGGGGNDMGVVGAGNQYNGGGGGGGTVAIADLDVTAGDYSITVGAKGTQATTTTATGTDGGDSYILSIGGVYISGGGGGRGGMGGGTAQTGTNGRAAPSTGATVQRGSGGGGGGGGVMPWNAGAGGGSGGALINTGTLPSGSMFITQSAGGNGGGPSYTDAAGGGGGSGTGGNGTPSGAGYEGKLWHGYSYATKRYGQGGQASTNPYTTPNTHNQNVGGYGKGGSQYWGTPLNGIVIIRWAP